MLQTEYTVQSGDSVHPTQELPIMMVLGCELEMIMDSFSASLGLCNTSLSSIICNSKESWLTTH